MSLHRQLIFCHRILVFLGFCSEEVSLPLDDKVRVERYSVLHSCEAYSFKVVIWKAEGVSQSNNYIFIVFALKESVILDVPQFPMKNIYKSCDLGRVV